MRRITLACVLALLALGGTAQAQGIGYTPGPSGRVLYSTAVAAPTTGTAQEVLATYTLPANSLKPGMRIRATALFKGDADANAKVVRIFWNGTGGTSVSNAATSGANANYMLQVVVTVLTSTTQMHTSTVTVDATIGGLTGRVTVDTANAIEIAVTGATSVQAGDVSLNSFIVEVLP